MAPHTQLGDVHAAGPPQHTPQHTPLAGALRPLQPPPLAGPRLPPPQQAGGGGGGGAMDPAEAPAAANGRHAPRPAPGAAAAAAADTAAYLRSIGAPALVDGLLRTFLKHRPETPVKAAEVASLHLRAHLDALYSKTDTPEAQQLPRNGLSPLMPRTIAPGAYLGPVPGGHADQLDQKMTSLPQMHRDLTLIHFNDVYHVLEARKKEPVGGGARFAALVRKRCRELAEPPVIFSGDAYSPSLLSTLAKGRHMIPVLARVRPHVAVYGNHDFDFGMDVLRKRTAELAEACGTVWLMTNATEKKQPRRKRAEEEEEDSSDEEGRGPIGDEDETGDVRRMREGVAMMAVKQHSEVRDCPRCCEMTCCGAVRCFVHTWRGIRIGYLGIIEKAWLDTVKGLNQFVEYHDMIETTDYWAAHLRQEHQCHCVIAITHMRLPQDEELLEACQGIDLILGGHDHSEALRFDARGRAIIKSGSDFQRFSVVTLRGCGGERPQVTKEDHPITSDITPDPEVVTSLKRYHTLLANKLNSPLCVFASEVDAAFDSVRTKETAVANLVAESMLSWRKSDGAEIAIVNSGCLRADDSIPAGNFTLGDLASLLPIEDVIVMARADGAAVRKCLENAVSRYPALEGRFLCVAGLRYDFRPEMPPGGRVCTILVNGERLEEDRMYNIVTTAYIQGGGDGFDALRGSELLVDAETGQLLPALFRAYLEGLPRPSAVGGLTRGQSMARVRRSGSSTSGDMAAMLAAAREQFLPVVYPPLDGRIHAIGHSGLSKASSKGSLNDGLDVSVHAVSPDAASPLMDVSDLVTADSGVRASPRGGPPVRPTSFMPPTAGEPANPLAHGPLSPDMLKRRHASLPAAGEDGAPGSGHVQGLSRHESAPINVALGERLRKQQQKVRLHRQDTMSHARKLMTSPLVSIAACERAEPVAASPRRQSNRAGQSTSPQAGGGPRRFTAPRSQTSPRACSTSPRKVSLPPPEEVHRQGAASSPPEG